MMSEIEMNDSWGDDQLIASDVSIPFLLEQADWTGLFKSKGYEGQYPTVLYMYDDADRLNDDIMAEINRTQVLDGDRQLRLDVYTHFEESEGDTEGRALVRVGGHKELDSYLAEDILYLLKSGVASWLTKSYSTHGVSPVVEWLESDSICEYKWNDWLSADGHEPFLNSPESILWIASVRK